MDGQLRFPLLSAARFAEANERARETIRKNLQPPVFSEFKGEVVSKYPRWFLAGVVAGLVFVLLLSFVISAGKQAAAAGMIFDHLPNKFGRLSELWASVSVGSTLFLSEIGSLLFFIGAGTLAQSMPKMKVYGRSINATAWVLRGFAVLCAGYAVTANATITALDSVPQAAILQWAITLGVPVIVLGIGALLEILLVDILASRSARIVTYEKALKDYQTVRAEPTMHASWSAVLADEMWREMTKYKRDRDLLEALAGEDREVRRNILVTEFQTQRRAESIDWNVEVPHMLYNPVASVPATVSDRITSAQTAHLSQGGAIVARPAQVGPAVAKAKAWLEANPDHGLPLRQAAELAGVSKDSMARAMQD